MGRGKNVGNCWLRFLPPPPGPEALVLLRKQEPVLFSSTIMENIRFGKPHASDAEVYAAARLANADGFIGTFPDGYNTTVGGCWRRA